MDRIRPDVMRRGALAAVVSTWALVMVLYLVPPSMKGAESDSPVRVVHWANGHPMDTVLLPTFRDRFNAAGYRTAAGSRIEVDVKLVNSSRIRNELVRRIQTGVPMDRSLSDPVVVTPVTEAWLHDVNHATNRGVFDVAETKSLVVSWVGIGTYLEMAECLGWPNREIGFADIVALVSHPSGWEQQGACARAEWGRPLVSFTDPNRSSTGRSVLSTLYSAAAGKPPERLAESDVLDHRVVEGIREFQRSVAHYVPDTLVLMDEVFAGPRYTHFFFTAEDNLAKLHRGKVVDTDPQIHELYARKRPTAPLDRSVVMIYPKEGSTAHTHPAAVVRADWVSGAEAEAAQQWITFLREDAQQSAFMEEGFRPATSLALKCPICGQYGIDPRGPAARVDASKIPPPVANRIAESWGDVKNPGVVVFVVDASPAMSGDLLRAEREAIVRAADDMYHRNLVGLVTFSESVDARVGVGPVPETRHRVAETLRDLRPGRGSALYAAIAEAVAMADAAPAESTAIRGVVVLSGGGTSTGLPLQSLIRMDERSGKRIEACPSPLRGSACSDANGDTVASGDVRGLGLTAPTQHAIGIYFIGVGDNADLEAGRIIAEATGTNYLGTRIEDLGLVVKLFSEYF